MKRSLLVLINLLSYASPSFGVLEKELEKVTSGVNVLLTNHYREISPEVPLYKGRSQLSHADYPKIPLVFPYKTHNIPVPFSASIPENQAHAHTVFQDFLSHEFSDYQKVYSFVVQSISTNDDLQYHALKPHCFVHPEVPYEADGNDLHSHLQWMVVRGDEGDVKPLKGDFSHGLHEDDIYTHAVPHHREDKMVMGMSADVMHLTGVNHNKSVDMHSFVAFKDTYHQNKKIVAITYHWLLNEKDINAFWNVLEKAPTFRGLINGLEPLASFNNMLAELKRYVDYSPKEEPLPVPPLPTVQKPAPQEQKAPVQAPQRPIVKKQVPQKQASPSPSQKPTLQVKAAPVRMSAKAEPVKTNAKSVLPAQKVVSASGPSVVQKPVAKSKAPILVSTPRIAKAAPVKTNAKPVLPTKKVVSVSAPSVVQKAVDKPKISAHRKTKAAPIKTNVKSSSVRVGAKVAPTPTKAKVLVRKVVKSVPIRSKAKVLFLKGKAQAALAKKEVLASKKTFVHKAEPKKTREQKRFKHGSKATAANRK